MKRLFQALGCAMLALGDAFLALGMAFVWLFTPGHRPRKRLSLPKPRRLRSPRSIDEAWAEDRRRIAGDFQAVGDDLREAIRKFEEGGHG